jgi:hypothetical protein
LYGAEDAAMCWALKQVGSFVVLWRTVLTSGRRLRGVSGLQMVSVLLRMAVRPSLLKRRSSVEKVWYDSNRSNDETAAPSWAIRLSNAILLLIMFAIITGPFVNLIPWSLTPRESLIGRFRVAVGIVNCHVGLVLWPCAFFLFRILLRQRRWVERIKLAALIALCIFMGWSATREVYWFWLSKIRFLVNTWMA